MEFNALQQLRPGSSRSTPISHNQARNANAMMYPYGNFPVPPQAAQQPTSQPSTQYCTWATGNSHPAVAYSPLQRRNTTALPHANNRAINRAQAVPEFPTRPHPAGMVDMKTQQTPTTTQGDMLPTSTMDTGAWTQKAMTDVDFASLDSEMTDFNNGVLHNDEDAPIIDLRQYTNFDGDDQQGGYNGNLSRRMSESSFSMSSTGPMAEVPSYDDFTGSVTGSERLSFLSDSDVWSSLEPPASSCSPTASPRHSYHDSLKPGSRSRASPAPYNVRSSPYTMDSTRNKRWSTGMYASAASTPAPQRHSANMNRHSYFYGSPLNPHHSIPHYPMQGMSLAPPTNPVLYSQPSQFQTNGATLFSSPEHAFAPEVGRQLPSQGLFRLLQSNADRHVGCASHFADLSDPPDLYSSLHEEPCDPPESDMHPSDPDLVPHEQDLRFTGDLYTPRWVRGHGNKREGWCGLCKPGRWLVLKNSAFWYDKSFTHGVSAATGAAFQGPQETRRTEGNLDVWEGLCGSCGDWIALVSSKKKGTTWFRHAYKCHTHPKVKDGPKRRRETSSNLRRAPSSSGSGVSSLPPPKDSPTLPPLPDLPLKHESSVPEHVSSGLQDLQLSIKSEMDLEHPERETTPQSHMRPLSTPQMAFAPAPYQPMTPDAMSIQHMHGQMGVYATPPHNKGASTMNPLDALGGMI